MHVHEIEITIRNLENKNSVIILLFKNTQYKTMFNFLASLDYPCTVLEVYSYRQTYKEIIDIFFLDTIFNLFHFQHFKEFKK